MPNLARVRDEVPVCPICEGPCTHDFARGPHVFPDRLPRAVDGTGDPIEEQATVRNRRGKRDE